jgi:hypothetical protein
VHGAIVIPALAGTIGLAAALVIGVIAGLCAAASGPRVTRRNATDRVVRTAANLRCAIVVTAVSFLAASAALVFPARAVWSAHDAAGQCAASGPGTDDRVRAVCRHLGAALPVPAVPVPQPGSPPGSPPGARAAGHSAASGPGTPARVRAGRPAPGADQRAASGSSVDPPTPDARLAAALTLVLWDYTGRAAVGVTDQATGVTAVYHGTESFDTASIVKADILAVLLLQLQQAGASIGAADRQLAARMIEDSDNAAASALWAVVGEGPGLKAGNAALGLNQTVPGPGGYWGLTTTTITDQLRLLAVLTSARSPLSAAARGYELSLMRDVEAGQNWGITKAASTGTRPAVKNGWLPVGPQGLWVINSIGVISHAGHQLAIAVLSAGNPSQSAGISLVQAAATTVACAVAAAGASSPDGSHRTRNTCARPGTGSRSAAAAMPTHRVRDALA